MDAAALAAHAALVPGEKGQWTRMAVVSKARGSLRRNAVAWKCAPRAPSMSWRTRPASAQCAASTGEKASTGSTAKEAVTYDSGSEWESEGEEEEEEDVGEVERILGTRVVDRATQYLIQWKDEHPDSWEPEDNIAAGIVEDYMKPWWVAARKGDDAKLQELLEEGRNPDAVDDNRRTAVFFAAGFGHEKSLKLLIDAGTDLNWQDVEGFTPLHMAAGYMQPNCARALLDAGADPDVEDGRKRTPLTLAQELLEKTPQNPFSLGRRLALDQIVKLLDESMFEEVEVQQVLDRRIGEGGVIEFLVRWSDGSEDSWEPTENIGEDLIRDYEQGLEYGVAEKILEKRESEDGGSTKVEYLVKWADSEENTWEPVENIAPEVVAAFEGVPVEEIEKRLEAVAS